MSNKLLRKIKRAKGQRSQDAIAQRHSRKQMRKRLAGGGGYSLAVGEPCDGRMGQVIWDAEDVEALPLR